MINVNTPTNESVTDGTVCIANIGPNQQRMRLRFGLVMFAMGILVAALLILTGVYPAWRIVLFLLPRDASPEAVRAAEDVQILAHQPSEQAQKKPPKKPRRKRRR